MPAENNHSDGHSDNTNMKTHKRPLYFGAGPAKLPSSVLQKIVQDTREYSEGLSIVELSHRSKEYERMNDQALEGLRKLCGFDPSHYSVLFVPGGATLQFAASVMNVMNRLDINDRYTTTIDYLISGYWSQRAADEAESLGYRVRRVNLVERDKTSGDSIVTLPPVDTLNKIVYYCQNETVDGVELPEIDFKQRVVICDVSSNFLTRPLNPRLYTILFAGAQKNAGIAGVTIVAVNETMLPLDRKCPQAPAMMDYFVHKRADSIYNTPPVSAVNAVKHMVDWILLESDDSCTLHQLDARAREKSSKLYALQKDTGVYYCPIQPEQYRSRINVVLKLRQRDEDDQVKATEDLISKARKHGISGIEGHRSVGGLRVSLYNAVDIEDVDELVKFLKENV